MREIYSILDLQSGTQKPAGRAVWIQVFKKRIEEAKRKEKRCKVTKMQSHGTAFKSTKNTRLNATLHPQAVEHITSTVSSAVNTSNASFEDRCKYFHVCYNSNNVIVSGEVQRKKINFEGS